MIQPPTRRPTFDRRDALVIAFFAALLVIVAVARLYIGDTNGFGNWPVLKLRGYRLLSGLSVGAALAVSGTLLQALMRNPLASPYLLGISSGAALGVVASHLGMLAFLGYFAGPACAVIAALGTLLIIYLLAQKRGWIDPLGLLLVGVIVNAILGAIIMFIHYREPQGLGLDITRWMLGYIDEGLSVFVITGVAGLTALGVAVASLLGRSIDVATFSDAEAHALGLHLPRLRLGMFALAGVLTAGSVMLAGPIGFVGLVCPHIVRVLVGPRHTPLILGAALAGSALVVGTDTAIKLVDLGLMPIGILMAMIGGPVFLWMLRPQLGRGADA
jgi:iron complex transport system permease protein